MQLQIDLNPMTPLLNVLSGKADVAVTAAGYIELLPALYNISLSNFRILNMQPQTEAMPFLHSIEPYPNVGLSVLPHVERQVSRVCVYRVCTAH